MRKKYKSYIIIILFLLMIGFASVATNLLINGNSLFGVNTDDFDVYFSSAVLDSEDYTNEIISESKREINFTSKELRYIGDTVNLEYEVTNNSTQYDAKVAVSCNLNDTDYLSFKNSISDNILAKTIEKGTLTITLKRTALEEKTININCKLDVTAIERVNISDGVIADSAFYSAKGYFVNESDTIIPNAKLVVYSDNQQQVVTDPEGYFYVENLERGSHEIYYLDTSVDTNNLTKDVIVEKSLAKANFTTTSKSIVFDNGYEIKYSVIEHVNNKIFNIKLNCNNGEELKDYEVIENHVYGILPTPIKAGYKFIGWYLNDLLITNSLIVKTSEDHTLTAKYEPVEYEVTFNYLGGNTSTSSKKVIFDKAYGELPTSIKPGYMFKGWYLDQNYTSGVTASTIVKTAKNHTLYAKWEARSNPVTFVNGTGGSVSASSINVGYYSSNTVTITPNETYYVSNISCTNGYTVEYKKGLAAELSQTIKITNNGVNSASTCTIEYGQVLTSAEVTNITSTGYDVIVTASMSTIGIDHVQFPTWTQTGGQNDLNYKWYSDPVMSGEALGNNNYKYHVDISDYNNEAGRYITHVYIFDTLGNHKMISSLNPEIITSTYAGSLYLSDTTAEFRNDKSYTLTSNHLYSNFTYEFDALANQQIRLPEVGTQAQYYTNDLNLLIADVYGNSPYAGMGFELGTNGAIVVAHSGGYYYVLLKYEGDLSAKHRYRVVAKNNIPYLYIDDTLVATGIAPVGSITTVFTNGVIGTGRYGSYNGYLNNIVLYNTAR